MCAGGDVCVFADMYKNIKGFENVHMFVHVYVCTCIYIYILRIYAHVYERRTDSLCFA